MILSWLLDTNEKVGLDYQIDKYFDHKMISFKDVVKKGENFSNVDVYKACEYAAEDALMTLKLFNKQLEVFKEKDCEDLLKLAFDLEFDFIYVLADMENNGIKIDVNLLKELKETNYKYIQELTTKIYETSGVEFNINSPKQLGVVLFETLALPTAKKTKTGYSTDEAVLNGLFDAHSVVPLLLNYREAYKLQSTYIEPLLELGLKNEDNRIHTSFLHTGTATGRLSSKNPNLQNIPVQSEAGSQIRSAFIPKDGYTPIVANILNHKKIEVKLNKKFDKTMIKDFDHIIWTGQLDQWFDYSEGRLGYRTLDFEKFESEGDFQGVAVMNYGDEEIPYTRISEHKHFTPWESHHKTIYFKEFSRNCEEGDIPYYPIRQTQEQEMLKQYVSKANNETKVTFVGRLGTYRYLDMDVTIKEALEVADLFLEKQTAPAFVIDPLA